MRTFALTSPALAALLLALAGCGGGDGQDAAGTPAPDISLTPSPTPAPANADEAAAVFAQFTQAIQDADLDRAWALYTASLPGDTSRHRADYGCDYVTFQVEFPAIRHMFARETPLQTTGTFGNAIGSPFVEFRMVGASGQEFLVTLTRVEPWEPYRLRWMNNGRPAADPLRPDPFPSPEDPGGFCGIWTGNR